MVLIGDAAGHNDPTIGQGLSIAMRDVRLVSEALPLARDQDDSPFADYAAERRERMRRLRFIARLTSKLRCEFDGEAGLRRSEAVLRMANDPSAVQALLVPFVGPYSVPDETFEEPAVRKLFGEQWSLTPDGWFQQAANGGSRPRPV